MFMLGLFSVVAVALAAVDHKHCCGSHKLSGVMLSMSAFHQQNEKTLHLDDVSNYILFEPRYGKTGFMHMRKQRRRSTVR